jgi:hypothetical protein
MAGTSFWYRHAKGNRRKTPTLPWTISFRSERADITEARKMRWITQPLL